VTTAGVAEAVGRDELVRAAAEAHELSNELIRRAVLEHSRFDILAEQVLGLTMEPVHLELLAFALEHPESMHLAFRGCGKTSSLSIPYAIGRLLQDPELRIFIGSRTTHYAKAILKEIKGHLESERLVEIFGEQRSEDKWEETEANVRGKKRVTKEASLTALGAESSVTGRHADILIIDDLVDEENARTKSQRERIKTFYYKTLDPCLEPGGERKIIGTRYHPHDLYGWLMANDMRHSTQIIPALHERVADDGETEYASAAPERFPVRFLMKKREKLPAIVWSSQWQCEVDRFGGEIFKPEFFEREGFFTDAIPDDAFTFIAVDPAATENTKNDLFALVVVRVSGDEVFVDDYVHKRMEFPKQVDACVDRFEQHEPIRLGFEANAYQGVLGQEIVARCPDLKGKVVPIFTSKDKITRALRLTAYFESGRIHFRRRMRDLVEHLLEFPEGEHDDLFDALDLAVTLGTRMRIKRRRSAEPEVF